MKKVRNFIFFSKTKTEFNFDENLFFLFARHQYFDAFAFYKIRLEFRRHGLHYIKMKNKEYDLILSNYRDYEMKHINYLYKGLGVVNVGYFVIPSRNFGNIFLLYFLLSQNFKYVMYPFHVKLFNQFINIITFNNLLIKPYLLSNNIKDIKTMNLNVENHIVLRNSLLEYGLKLHFSYENYNFKSKFLFLIYLQFLLSKKYFEILES